ncbi:uncharacterized protein CIMG_09523 [Coccidioides immitis RS]|nr:uncharacterized protein CIMG_09523 [Coccidioides immitis RS]EAS28319.3 hypothetical protein CIMG_09523 [Coccidioides immitis RS]KMU85962.1 hypothetical protein CIHG_03492 [Coccidioides immitis H538.4]TPX20951.1 hypothetical protein DIZ76_016848 [Coccidioides immitis]
MRLPQSLVFLAIGSSIPLTSASPHAYELAPADRQPALLSFAPNQLPTPGSSLSLSRPSATNSPVLDEREIVNAPPVAQPTKHSQMSPVMTVNIGGKPVLYTQKFSDVPDQWPQPKQGTIGLGSLKGKIGQTKTIGKRSPVETTTLNAKQFRCRTPECAKALSEDAVILG